ncbi:MAG: hypothetical protein Q9163_003577 [Psora crenata]
MPSYIRPQEYGEAILDHARSGAYPGSEDLVSSELPTSALSEVLELIEHAREDVKRNIRSISAETGPDIDGWISQAKQLRIDIERSQEEAQQIVGQAQRGKTLDESLTDAKSKFHLLQGELEFNRNLEVTLERLQALRSQLDQIQQAVLENNSLEVVDLLCGVHSEVASVSSSPNSRVAAVFSSEEANLRSDISAHLINCWNAYIHIDRDRPRIEIRRSLDGSPNPQFESIVESMRKLGTLDNVLLPLCKDLESLILLPRLHVQAGGTVELFEVEDDILCSAGPSSDLSAEALFSDLQALMQFLRDQLPPSVLKPLTKQLMPVLMARILHNWLASAVPAGLDGIQDFQNTLSLAQNFGHMLDSYNLPSKTDLDEWINGIPDLWLKKYQETSLHQVRKLLSGGLGFTEVVERVETQVMSHDAFAGNGGGDEWNASWSDEEDRSPVGTSHTANADPQRGGDDEEDGSAWGLDEKEGASATNENPNTSEDEEDAEEWGWGDDTGQEPAIATQSSTAVKAKTKTLPTNGVPNSARATDRQVTLRETYTITSLIREIFDLIRRFISDSSSLEDSEYAKFSIAKKASSLLSLPGLALAMYRAGSFSAYGAHSSGKMFLYNDALWLAEQLQNLSLQTITSSEQSVPDIQVYNLHLRSHISALESHGKRGYAREMESQRTIITDLLDGAQGFMHCTEHPFNEECDIAIASTIDRLRQLHREWKVVLSHSALLQSLGSLLSTLCSKIILDIEDMSDISEPESQQLAAYCSRVAALEELFNPSASDPTSPSNEGTPQLTAVYASAWLKFQYLANILESSLVDIKYLWTEGELSLEFEVEELVDLIIALFADSPHRKSAISEIRASKQ